jgi:hypothetical protein
LTNDGKPYAPIRYKELVKERYLISRYMNTSYTDLGQLTPTERKYIIEFILNENKSSEQKSNEMYP